MNHRNKNSTKKKKRIDMRPKLGIGIKDPTSFLSIKVKNLQYDYGADEIRCMTNDELLRLFNRIYQAAEQELKQNENN